MGSLLHRKKDFDFARGLAEPNEKRRSIEADIMDWADDVAYSLHDIDDFYRAGFVPIDQILTESAETERFLKAMFELKVIDALKDGVEFFKRLRECAVEPELLSPYQGTRAQHHALNKLEALLIRRYLGLDAPGAVKLNPDSGPRLFVEPKLREEVNLALPLTAVSDRFQANIAFD
jgi:dGTPase